VTRSHELMTKKTRQLFAGGSVCHATVIQYALLEESLCTIRPMEY
jgi:hypothetical protein